MSQHSAKQKTTTGGPVTKTLTIYELELPLAVCVGIGATYIVNEPLVHECLFISYKDPSTGLYDKGLADVYFVLTWATLLTFLRTIFRNMVFLPLAAYLKVDDKKLVQFAEQCWDLVYYVPSWTTGVYIAYNSPYWLNTLHLWKGYPHFPFTALMKGYYLIQMAFWVHKMLVLNLEKRRKDHYPMMAHHIVTLMLLTASYYENFLRIGNVVLIIMDLADIVLPLAKILNYLNFRRTCDFMFVMFAVSWVITRHVLFGFVIYSTIYESRDFYEWNPAEGKYMTRNSIAAFTFLFISLELLLIYWFSMIVKVAWKLLSEAAPAHDNRSDSE